MPPSPKAPPPPRDTGHSAYRAPDVAPRFLSLEETAHWVAAYRARSEAAGAGAVDPYAEVVAGTAGEHLAKALPGQRTAAWAIAARTRAIDAFLSQAVGALGVDTVLNLGAGLDARPQRLALPREVRWVEVDRPGVLAHKATRLPGPLPCYALERIACDLLEPHGRVERLRSLVGQGTRTLVLSEGFVVYLTAEQVLALARDLAGAGVGSWVLDLVAADVLPRLNARWARALSAAGAELRFAPKEGPRFFEGSGWRVADFRSLLEEVRSFPGAPRLLGRFAEARVPGTSLSGVARLERVADPVPAPRDFG